MILAMGLAYDGLAQMIAGIMEYKRGNTFGTVAFSSYGLFSWFLVALLIFLKSVSGILFRRLRFNLHPTLRASARAVKEGREIYDNIKKYLTYLLRCNIMEILVLFIAMMLIEDPKSAIALTTIQLLWVNLTTDGLPAIALGVDPGDPDLMERKPRDLSESIFTRDVKAYLFAVPVLMTVLLLGGYFYTLETYGLLEARTQLFTALVLMELANAVNARSLKYTVFKVGVFKNKFLWYAILSSLGLQLMVLYIPAFHGIFDVTYPTVFDWTIAIVFTLIVFFSIEIVKHVVSRRRT